MIPDISRYLPENSFTNTYTRQLAAIPVKKRTENSVYVNTIMH